MFNLRIIADQDRPVLLIGRTLYGGCFYLPVDPFSPTAHQDCLFSMKMGPRIYTKAQMEQIRLMRPSK